MAQFGTSDIVDLILTPLCNNKVHNGHDALPYVELKFGLFVVVVFLYLLRVILLYACCMDHKLREVFLFHYTPFCILKNS